MPGRRPGKKPVARGLALASSSYKKVKTSLKKKNAPEGMLFFDVQAKLSRKFGGEKVPLLITKKGPFIELNGKWIEVCKRSDFAYPKRLSPVLYKKGDIYFPAPDGKVWRIEDLGIIDSVYIHDFGIVVYVKKSWLLDGSQGVSKQYVQVGPGKVILTYDSNVPGMPVGLGK